MTLQDLEKEIAADISTFEAGGTVTIPIAKFSDGPVTAELVPDKLDVTLWGWLPIDVSLSSYKVTLPALGPALVTAAQDAVQIVKTT